MNKKFDKLVHSKYFVIVLILIFICLTALLGTYAWFTWSSSNNTTLTMTIGKMADVIFTSGNEINSELTPVFDYTDGLSTDFKIINRDRTGALIGYKVKFNIETIAPELANETVKYTLVKNGNVVAQGDFSYASNDTSITIETSTIMSGTTSFVFYLYIDGNVENDLSMMDKTITGTITVEATDGANLANHITSLYQNASKTIVTDYDSTEHNIATSVNLVNDRLGGVTEDYDAGNIRYYGEAPNNYIYFNCDDYSNQNEDTCEVWRIIGIFDNKVKIMRNGSIGAYSWDYTSSGTYDNDWHTSSLMKLLNDGYYNNKDGITYYNNSTTASTINFKSDGMGITEATRSNNLISSEDWHLEGGVDTACSPSYTYSEINSNNNVWNGKIALVEMADFGYAGSSQNCIDSFDLSMGCDSELKNWMSNIITKDGSNHGWLLTIQNYSAFDNYKYIFDVSDNGMMVNTQGDSSNLVYEIVPTLYLEPEILINQGTGSSSNPYQIYIKKTTIIEHITNLYTDADKTQVTNNGIEYNYAPSVRLMNDRLGDSEVPANGGNIRYYGADDEDLNNYIYFNCSDYSNQSSSTCETWRIIGIVDGKVKIIKNNTIGQLAWDTNGTNNWTNASLNSHLNNIYSLRGRTTKLISPSTWYIGGANKDINLIYSDEMYQLERTNIVEDNTTAEWTGKVALMNASDYGYATDFSSCDKTLANYSNQECYTNDWLNLNSDSWSWVLSPAYYGVSYDGGNTINNYQKIVWHIFAGSLNNYGPSTGSRDSNNVNPALYLDPELTFYSGDGSSKKPYEIYVEPSPPTLVEYVTNLYTGGNPTLITQETSNDSYYYSYQDDTNTWGLMNDGLKIDNTRDDTNDGLATAVTDSAALTSGAEGNIRYFGPSASVNNYIYFNCEIYPDTNCELWRIIGIVDGKVKIIKEESIGGLAWDQDKNQDSTKTTYNNNWTTSSLQEFLNGLYYNRGTKNEHTYYSGPDGTTSTTLYLSDIGITEATRNNNLISESTWYLGGYSTPESLYPNDIYKYERQNKIGITIYSTNDFTINKSIGLMYSSDYGYGTDLTKCGKDIYNYDTLSACKTNNWLFNNANQWLLAPTSGTPNTTWGVIPTSRVFGANVYYADTDVRPVLYLNSELSIESEHEGTSSDPYRISVS